jgi:hypothetical protein
MIIYMWCGVVQMNVWPRLIDWCTLMMKTTQRDRFFIDAVQHSHLISSPKKNLSQPKEERLVGEGNNPTKTLVPPSYPKTASDQLVRSSQDVRTCNPVDQSLVITVWPINHGACPIPFSSLTKHHYEKMTIQRSTRNPPWFLRGYVFVWNFCMVLICASLFRFKTASTYTTN